MTLGNDKQLGIVLSMGIKHHRLIYLATASLINLSIKPNVESSWMFQVQNDIKPTAVPKMIKLDHFTVAYQM